LSYTRQGTGKGYPTIKPRNNQEFISLNYPKLKLDLSVRFITGGCFLPLRSAALLSHPPWLYKKPISASAGQVHL
jgi:hypothetical protein